MDLISRLSELRGQYNCFDESERDAYHTLSEAIKALSDVLDTNVIDCSDCIKHGGDFDCDHVHCHKGKQPDNDMIHLQKEQAYLQGWEEGRKALREEMSE